MIENTEVRKAQAQQRQALTSCAQTLSNVIVEGTNCSAFEAQIIAEKAKEVFCLGEYNPDATLQPGQMIWRAIDANEPPGKPLKRCIYKKIVLTVHCLEGIRKSNANAGTRPNVNSRSFA